MKLGSLEVSRSVMIDMVFGRGARSERRIPTGMRTGGHFSKLDTQTKKGVSAL